MSLLIKGMEMPKERESFTVTIKYNGLVFDTETGIQVAEAQEVPPHGRLIDADELYKEALKRSETKDGYYNCLDPVISCYTIDHAPTIIPAEEGADGGDAQ